MDINTIKERIKWFICTCLGFDKDLLNYDTFLDEGEMILDSIDAIDLISFIDSEYGVNMSNVSSNNFKNIDAIASYIIKNIE